MFIKMNFAFSVSRTTQIGMTMLKELKAVNPKLSPLMMEMLARRKLTAESQGK